MNGQKKESNDEQNFLKTGTHMQNIQQLSDIEQETENICEFDQCLSNNITIENEANIYSQFISSKNNSLYNNHQILYSNNVCKLTFSDVLDIKESDNMTKMENNIDSYLAPKVIKVSKTQNAKYQWIEELFFLHPFKLLIMLRVFILVPLIFAALMLAINGNNWLYLNYVDDSVLYNTSLSLRAMHRKSYNNTSNMAFITINNPVSFDYILRETNESNGVCNNSNVEKNLNKVLKKQYNNDDLENTNNRDHKLLLLSILYGPIFNDINCAYMSEIQKKSVIVFALIILCVLLTCIEELFLLSYLLLTNLYNTAELVYKSYLFTENNVRKISLIKEIDKSTAIKNNSDYEQYVNRINTAISYYSTSINNINNSQVSTDNENNDDIYRTQELLNIFDAQIKSLRMDEVLQTSLKNMSIVSTTLTRLQLTYYAILQTIARFIWQQPVLKLFNTIGCKDNINVFTYLISSFYEYTNMLICMSEVILITSCVFIYQSLHKQNMCVDQSATLNKCKYGYNYYFFIIGYMLILLNLCSHLVIRKFSSLIDILQGRFSYRLNIA